MATEPIILPQAPAAQPVTLEVIASPKKKSRTTLAVLICLFLITYGLVLTVVVFQGITINSQRLLILDLFRDSSELNAMRMKDIQKNRAAAEKNKNKAEDKSQDKARAAKPKHRMHQPPPAQFPDGPDVTDARRTQVSI